MKKLAKSICSVAAALLIIYSIPAYAQPSSAVGFYFRLFDHNGKQVSYDTFCRQYQLLNDSGGNAATSCTNTDIPKAYTYNEATGYFNGSGGVITNDLVRKFIHEKDTMKLVLLAGDQQNVSYKIDSLYIKPGSYVIVDQHLKSIDFKKGEVEYYNRLIKWSNFHSPRVNNPELNQLKIKYNISPDDFTPKTLREIFKN